MEHLTHTEEQIAAFVREGRYDAEIAVRLGLTTEDVQRRIERICAKLGLRNRAALRTPEVVPITEGAASDKPERAERSGLRRASLFVAAAFASLFAAGAALLAVLGAKDDDTTPAAIAAPEPTPSLAPAAPPFRPTAIPAGRVSIGGVRERTLVEGSPRHLPPEVEVLYTARTTSDGGWAMRLYRAYRASPNAATLTTDLLYSAPDGYALVDALATQDGSDIVVAITLADVQWDEPTVYRFLRSRDGGVTWTAAGPALDLPRDDPAGARAASLVAFDGEEIIIAVHHGQQARYQRLSTGEALDTAGGSLVPWTSRSLATIAGDDMEWEVIAGSQAFRLGPATGPTHSVSAAFFEPEGSITASWTDARSGSPIGYFGVYGADGNIRTLLSLEEDGFVVAGGWLDHRSVLAVMTIGQGNAPVIVDIETAEYFPVLELPGSYSFQELLAIRHGPAAVVAPAEECLPLFEEPDVASRMMTCAAPGVRLLTSGFHAREPGAELWYAMTTGRFGPIGWVRPGPALWFDDRQFPPRRYGNTIAMVRPPDGADCAEVHRSAGDAAIVDCLPAGTLVGHALQPLGIGSEQLWYAVFWPSSCQPVPGCRGEALGFVRAEHLERQP